MGEKVINTKKELYEGKARASKVKGELWEKKEHMDVLSMNIVHLMIKLGEAGSCIASTH